MTEITIENQTITLNCGSEITKKRYRISAFLIIWLIRMTIGIFFGTPHEEGIGYRCPAFSWMCSGLFLWPISEGIWGQTIGKRIMDLKVVTNDLKPIRIRQTFGYIFLGFIDYMLLIGLIITATNK